MPARFALSQHEARAQRDEISQVVAVPFFLHHDQAAKAVGRRGGETEQHANDNWVHRVRGREYQESAAVANVHNVAILDNVVFAFQPQNALRARIGF